MYSENAVISRLLEKIVDSFEELKALFLCQIKLLKISSSNFDNLTPFISRLSGRAFEVIFKKCLKKNMYSENASESYSCNEHFEYALPHYFYDFN